MKFVLLLVVPPILLFGLGVALSFAPLPRPLPDVGADGRDLFAALTTGALGLVWVACLVGYTVKLVFASGSYLDGAMASLGLSSKRFMMFGMRYAGAVDGRPVEVTFQPATQPKPSALDVTLWARPVVGATIGLRRPLLDGHGYAPVSTSYSELQSLRIRASDPALFQTVLADPGARGVVARLFGSHALSDSMELYVQQDRLWLRVRASGIAPEAVVRAIDDLAAVARACEAARMHGR